MQIDNQIEKSVNHIKKGIKKMWAACKVLDTADLLGNSHKFLEFIQNQNKKHSTWKIGGIWFELPGRIWQLK